MREIVARSDQFVLEKTDAGGTPASSVQSLVKCDWSA